MPRLYLVRHGTALPPEVDPEKHLSPEGRADIEAKGKKLKSRHPISLDKIFHSDKARAIETAEIFHDTLTQKCGCSERAGLSPMDDPTLLIPELEALEEDWMIVSHLPFLDRLLSRLVTGSDEHRLVNFGPGSTVCLARAEGCWLLEWID